MIGYIKPIYNNNPNKIAIKRECGGCWRPLNRNSRNQIGHLCSKCKPRTNGRLDSNSSLCYDCPFILDCTARVQLGLWVRCETPDVADLERLKFVGGLNDKEISRGLEVLLEQRGERKVLEEAISKSASKIYKIYSDGQQGEMPIGIRERS